MDNFLYKTVLIFSTYIYIYILFAKIIKISWSRDVTDIRVLVYFESKIHKEF